MNKRRPLIVGNWKLHLTVAQSERLVQQLCRKLSRIRQVDIAVAPGYVALWPVARKLVDTSIALAAQDVFFEDEGAFTGAVSATQLHDVGCQYVLVGHSERRQYFAETNSSTHLRLQAVLRAKMVPILCVGESLSERQNGDAERIVTEQLKIALGDLSVAALGSLVVAYEPVWAIGTGQVATAVQAQQMHAIMRQQLCRRDPVWGQDIRLLYGGSVKASNATKLLEQADVDGALVGGASLQEDEFSAIVVAASGLNHQ